MVAEGWSNPAIARKLSVEIKTVENHLTTIFDIAGIPARGGDVAGRVVLALRYLYENGFEAGQELSA